MLTVRINTYYNLHVKGDNMKENKLINIILARKKVNTKENRLCPDCGKQLYYDGYVGRFQHVVDFCCYAENEYGECIMNNDMREKLATTLKV